MQRRALERELPDFNDDKLTEIKQRHDTTQRNLWVRSRKFSRTRSIVAVLAVIVVILCGTVVAVRLLAPSATHRSQAGGEFRGTASTRALPGKLSAGESAIKGLSPLAAGKSIKCSGALLPSAVLASPGGAETQNTPGSQALRAYLKDNSGGFLTPADQNNWALLSSSKPQQIFGHKIGAVGVDKIVSFVLNGDGNLVLGASTGCTGPVLPNGDTSAPIVSALVTGSKVTLHWANSACGTAAPADKVLVEVEQLVVGNTVHVLLVTKENPLVPAGPQSCGGVSIDSTETIVLNSPLAGGQLFDDYGIPAEKIPLNP